MACEHENLIRLARLSDYHAFRCGDCGEEGGFSGPFLAVLASEGPLVDIARLAFPRTYTVAEE